MRFQIIALVLAAVASSVMAAPMPVAVPEPQEVSKHVDSLGFDHSRCAIDSRSPLPLLIVIGHHTHF